MSAKHRFVSASWLLFACIGLIIGGRVLWPHETSNRRTVLVVPAPRVIHKSDGVFSDEIQISAGRKVTTGHAPNHVPAILLFAIGGAAGVLGIFLMRKHPAPAPTGELPESN